MNNQATTNIETLEKKAEELLALTQRLSAENTQLKAQLFSLKTDKSGLVEQKELVRSQVEGMISRLKAMESA